MLHFDFTIPEGAQGAPGEVTEAELTAEISSAITSAVTPSAAASSNNSNAVALFGGSISDPPTAVEVQAIADKLNELINALRR